MPNKLPQSFACSRGVANFDCKSHSWSKSRRGCNSRNAFFYKRSYSGGLRPLELKKLGLRVHKSKRMELLLLASSADDGVTVNGTPQASGSSGIDEMRIKLSQSLQGNDINDGLVQSLHDAARVFELAIKGHRSGSKMSWFPKLLFGGDNDRWIKTLSYQAAVYSLLQAASELSPGDGGDKDLIVFVQRSLLRLSAPLESFIRDTLSAKQPEAYEWFWSEQVPSVVSTFLNYFEKDLRHMATAPLYRKGLPSGSFQTSDVSLLMLALTCIAAVIKIGPTRVASPQLFSIIPDVTGRTMEMLVDCVPIRQAYYSIKEVGLHREFLVHLGPRAATCGARNDRSTEEVTFWVDLIQKQLQRAIDREKIWSRLTTCESIEVLEKDLAIFGFFIALGRSTKAFLQSNGFDVLNDALEGYIRYLIGGSVLYYPQLASISSYQLYVEVVCEELDWLPFYQASSNSSKAIGHKIKREGPPNAEAIHEALNVCSNWTQGFIKYSKWLENPANAKAAKFLSKGHSKLLKCKDELGLLKKNADCKLSVGSSSGSETSSAVMTDINSFDKALGSVDEALIRLESLLQDLHLSSTNTGKEHLKAACSDLERIRKLKKEAEFLEASFRAKAASLQQGEDESDSQSFITEQRQFRGLNKNPNAVSGRVSSKPGGLWSFMLPRPVKSSDSESSNESKKAAESQRQVALNIDTAESEEVEIDRFEVLKNELIELEKRVQSSADQPNINEDLKASSETGLAVRETGNKQLERAQKSENIIEKSLEKLKETTTDVWQGTQLLAIDVAAATELVRRSILGDELAEKEKRALQRTVTDVASVIPIGILMLLPVTAVGHAAMLAAIQRYVPSLIPSTYGPDRLDLLRQLQMVKELEDSEVSTSENVEETTQ
uniref:LETM1-like protein n=1 Tax=Kalanchoe fedtschenkoi TaxID=63787 RepID=A0A7N1A1P8_KALFE